MDGFEMPSRKRPSIGYIAETTCEQIMSSTSFFNLTDFKNSSILFPEVIPASNSQVHKRPAAQITVSASGQKPTVSASSSNSHSGYPTAAPLLTMSKLTMNIGYAKHLATSVSTLDNHHQAGHAILEPSQYTSYNLLSNKRLQGPAGITDSLSLGNGQANDPFSYQQAHLEVRKSQETNEPKTIDYPLQSPQLNSMYANSANSSSINDFKLLMSQTSINDFSNWNDGTIWQPRALTHNSSSSKSLFSDNESFHQSDDYDETLDDIPSFDEAMDMMMSSR
jgi:hypothetical protein